MKDLSIRVWDLKVKLAIFGEIGSVFLTFAMSSPVISDDERPERPERSAAERPERPERPAAERPERPERSRHRDPRRRRPRGPRVVRPACEAQARRRTRRAPLTTSPPRVRPPDTGGGPVDVHRDLHVRPPAAFDPTVEYGLAFGQVSANLDIARHLFGVEQLGLQE